MSEQAAEQTGGEQGSPDLGISRAADASRAPATASGAEAVPVSEPAASEPSLSEPSIANVAAPEPPKAEAVKAEAKPIEAGAPVSQPEPTSEKTSHLPGKVIVMPRGERAWTDHDIHAGAETAERQSMFGKRRIAAVAAMLALATTGGAVGGALATASLMHGSGDVASAASSQTSGLTASLSRIDSDIQALRTGLDHTSKLGMSQFNKTSERLDKLERSQAEPAAKLAKLSEAVDKLHALPVPPPAVAAAASVASKETTGSISSTSAPQQVAAVAVPKNDPKLDAKTEVGRLPTLDDWVLRDVGYGGALIGSRRGTYEVYAGDMIPGLGRVDAIRRQDGRWVVVTSRGLIVAR